MVFFFCLFFLALDNAWQWELEQQRDTFVKIDVDVASFGENFESAVNLKLRG